MDVAALVAAAPTSSAPKQKPLSAMHADIDSRLDRLRAELASIMPQHTMPPYAAAAPSPSMDVSMDLPPSYSRDQQVLLHMPHFETQRIRAARRAMQNARMGRPNSAGSHRPRSPGQRPIGYRIMNAHRSTPAYTMAAKWEIPASMDPTAPEVTPGPGTYDTTKY